MELKILTSPFVLGWSTLVQLTHDDEASIDFAQEFGFLPMEMACLACGNSTIVKVQEERKIDGYS